MGANRTGTSLDAAGASHQEVPCSTGCLTSHSALAPGASHSGSLVTSTLPWGSLKSWGELLKETGNLDTVCAGASVSC